LPAVNLVKDTFLCEGDEIELNANNAGAQYIWNTGENTQTIKARNTGKYWVTVNSHNCISADTITLKICPPNIFVPNAFTPDNDSTNDVFLIYGSDISEAELKIFNRWGECVFETKDLKQGWNGKFKNHLCPVDRYVWILRYKGKRAPQAQVKQISGTVNLIR
jgi:gliding motility-associated-like protein